jgi:hypothetical protein
MGNDPTAIFFTFAERNVMEPRQSYEVAICAYPTLPEGGRPARRSFYITPQPDGGIIFSDSGRAS